MKKQKDLKKINAKRKPIDSDEYQRARLAQV